MNLLGKIFTFVILIFSLMVVIVAMFVYATHRNWRADYEALNSQLQSLQTQLANDTAKYETTVNQLQAEKVAAQEDVSKLESELQIRVAENRQFEQQLDNLTQQVQQSIAAVTATEANNKVLLDDVNQTREELLTAISDRDAAVLRTTQATVELHDTANELSRVVERNSQLLDDIARATALLDHNGIDPEGDVVPHVRGLISSTRREAGVQLVEITIGADDGIKPRQTVEVFRGSRYLGRVEILKTDPDRSVGRVIREYQQGPIQEDDDVATKLRAG